MTRRHWWLLGLAGLAWFLVLYDGTHAQSVLPCRPWRATAVIAPEGVHAYTDGAAVAFMAAYLRSAAIRTDVPLAPAAVYVLADGDRVRVVMILDGEACWWPETTRQVYDRARRLAMGTPG